MKRKLKSFINILLLNELRILPGNLAYSFFLAIIPILSLIFYVVTTFNLPSDIIQNFITVTFPSGVSELLQPIFDTKMTLNSLLPICLGIFVAANGCNAIIIASNTIYDFKNASYLRRMIKAIFLVIMLTILFAFIFVVPLLGRTIINLIATFTDFVGNNKQVINTLYFLLQVPVSIFIMFFILKAVFTIAPDEKIPSRYVNRGALFTATAWLLVTIGFSYYINHIARFDIVYGNLTNIVILLFWFYILAYIFVIGLVLNKRSSQRGIEETNAIKLEEIRKRIKENK